MAFLLREESHDSAAVGPTVRTSSTIVGGGAGRCEELTSALGFQNNQLMSGHCNTIIIISGEVLFSAEPRLM